jgi:hypothetical protein
MEVGEESPEGSANGGAGIGTRKRGRPAKGLKRNGTNNGSVVPHGSRNGTANAAVNSVFSAYNLDRFCDPDDQEHKLVA